MKTVYLVEFIYYHYNTGRGDNGNFTARIKAKDLDDARRIRDKINTWVPKADDMNINHSDWNEYLQLCDECLDGEGHFLVGYPARIIERQEMERVVE